MLSKIRVIIFIMIASIYSNGQEVKPLFDKEREVKLEDFINLKIFSGIEVKLIPSEENRLVISGEDNIRVVVKNRRKTLKIRHSLEHIINPKFTYVEIYHRSLLDEISLYQGSSLSSDSIFSQTSISLKVQEGSIMNINFEGEKISSSVTTGGQLFLSGKVTNHQNIVNSGGACEAETLITEQTKVSVTAGGLSYVKASKLIEARVTAGGIIRIYGSPQKIVTKKTIGGQIFEMK